MCNSRGITDDQDDGATATTIDFKKIALKCIPSKLGRKGDPRMHKALEARLNDPKLSLFDALKIGGFKFHWEQDVSYDEDHVLLSQRKNQLSRRIRLYKQSHQKNSEDDECADGASKTRSEAVTKRKTTPDDMPSKQKKRMRKLDAKETQMPKKADNQDPSLVAPVHQNLERDIASLFQLNPSGGTTNTHGDNPVSSQAVAPMITPSSSLSSHLSDKQERMNLALDLYSSDSPNFMKKCMLAAGFSHDEVESCKQYYLEFGERALENERMRLQTMKMSSTMGSGGNVLAPVPTHASTISSQRLFNSNMIPSNSLVQFETGGAELMPCSDENISLSQQTAMCRYYFNQSCQSNSFPNISMPHTLPHDISLPKSDRVGPRVLDLKQIEIEGDEWKSILQKSELSLDRMLGLNS